jgi:acetyl-CoA carboxylase biotin carboxyl carrier protein
MIKKKAVPKKPAAAPSKGSGPFGDRFEAVRELARIATEFDLSEVEADPSGRIRVARRLTAGPAAAPLVSPASLSLMSSPAPAAEKADDRAAVITSPFVGTFYRSPSPDAASFVDIGQTVRKGQVVCIVEAMKLMNEIESELDGKLLDVLVKNGEHVEYGQALFRIEKP